MSPVLKESFFLYQFKSFQFIPIELFLILHLKTWMAVSCPYCRFQTLVNMSQSWRPESNLLDPILKKTRIQIRLVMITVH